MAVIRPSLTENNFITRDRWLTFSWEVRTAGPYGDCVKGIIKVGGKTYQMNLKQLMMSGLIRADEIARNYYLRRRAGSDAGYSGGHY